MERNIDMNLIKKYLDSQKTKVVDVFDAENKKIGRIATQAAVFLMGKNKTDFARNAIPDVTV